jgi:hypothetical protein
MAIFNVFANNKRNKGLKCTRKFIRLAILQMDKPYSKDKYAKNIFMINYNQKF